MNLSRSLTLVSASVVLALGLTGCAGSESSSDSSKAVNTSASCATSGQLSDSVKASGSFGATPEDVTFPTPMVSETTQVSTLIQGDGEQLDSDSAWSVAFSLFSGSSTTASGVYGFPSSDSNSTTPVVLQPSGWTTSWPGLSEALACGNVGDRFAIVMGMADNASAASGLSLDTTASMVLVLDVLGGSDARATGSSQSVSDIFPTVTLATDGQPGISTPKGDAPTETTIGVLKKGDGATVGATDTAIVQYSGWLWSDGTQFDSSWGTGQLLSASSSGIIPGFWKAVEGQTVGSQVIVIVPPKDGYGDTAQGSIPASSTLVFVVDILSVG